MAVGARVRLRLGQALSALQVKRLFREAWYGVKA